MTSLARTVPVLLVLCAPWLAGATSITIDGKYADWANVTTFTDPNDNLKNDIKSLAITDDLGADGKPGGTDHLYLKLEMWATNGKGGQSIVVEYPDGTSDTFTVKTKSVTVTSCNNCISFAQTTDAVTGVLTWEISILFSDLGAGFAKNSAYALHTYALSQGGTDRDPNAGKNVFYDAGTDLATSAQIVSQSAQELPGGGVVVRWRTGAEVDNAGFLVWKQGRAGLVPVSGLVHAAGAGGRGATYDVFDAGGRIGDVYSIEDVDDRGVRTLHPSFVAVPAPALDAGALTPLLSSPAIRARPAVVRLAVSQPPIAISTSSGAAVLGASAEGIYAVDPSELVAAGIDPAAVAGRRVSLARGGRFINLVSAPAAGQKLLFYAPAPVNPYDGVDRYRVQPGPPVQGPMPRLVPPLGSPTPSFVSTVVARQLQQYDWYQPGADPYAWQLIRPSSRGVVSLALPDPAPGAQGSIHVHLTGGKLFDHAYDVVLNGTVLGTAVWSGRNPYQGSFEVPASVIDPSGRNVLEVRAQAGVSASDYVYLHDVTARYDRRFVASLDELSFEAPSGRTVLVSGFTRPDLVLLDVTDPAAPRSLPVQPFVDFTGHFSVAFRDTAGGVIRYRIAAAPMLKRPTIRAFQDRLRLEAPAADLLIVTSDELKPALSKFVAARRAQGLMVEVATTSEIDDAYSGGDAGPDALRAFVADALAHWQRAPRFLLLAGQGSMDPRGLLGGVDREQVPAVFTITRDYHLRAPSDVSYAIEGGVVRMAVGRIPASTAVQLEGALAKILAQEAAPRLGHSLVIADGPRDAVAFESAGQTMAKAIPGGADLLDASLVPDAAARIATELPRSDLVTYVGHAWTGGWGGGATLLDAPAAATLTGRAPVVLTSTCWESNFSDQLGESVAVNLLLDPRGGSSASYGPTTILDLADHERLVTAVLGEAGAAPTIGEAVQRGQQDYLDLGGDRPDPALTFAFLGDPSMRSPVGP